MDKIKQSFLIASLVICPPSEPSEVPRDQIKLHLLLFPPLLLCQLLRAAQPCFPSHEGFVFMQIRLPGAPSSRQDPLHQVPLVAAHVLRGGLRPVGRR